MTTKVMDVYGKVKFIHAVNLGKFGEWTIVIYPDNKSLEVIRELQAQGLKNVMKKDDDGYYMQFKRAPQKLMRGKMVSFTAPKVVDSDGKLMDGQTVGYGSDVTVRLEVYKYGAPSGGKSVAARWDSLKINNLIPFEVDKSDWSEDEKENIKDLAASPEPEVW